MAASSASWAAIPARRARTSISPSTTSCSVSPPQRLGDESAACVVMDVTNGDVLALASTPGFDPNLFNVGIKDAQWKALTTDDHKPLINKAISGTYPPGSTFKPAMALSALEAGAIDAEFHRRLHRLAPLRQLRLPLLGAQAATAMSICTRGIQHSCDIFFYEVARRLGIDGHRSRRAQARPGAAHRISRFPAKARGIIPGRAWKLARFGMPWQQGETLNTGIGQGYVPATPHSALHAGRAHRQRQRRRPRITRVVGKAAQPRPVLKRLDFSDKSLQLVQSGMNAAYQRAGRHGLFLAHRRAGLRNGRQDRHRPGAPHLKGRTRVRRTLDLRVRSETAVEIARARACSSPSRRFRFRAMPARSSSSTAARCRIRTCRSCATFFSSRRSARRRCCRRPIRRMPPSSTCRPRG